MYLLDAVGTRCDWDNDGDVDFGRQFAAAISQECDAPYVVFLRNSRRAQDILRISARREKNQKVAGPPMRFDLTSEDLLKAKVICNASQFGRIRECEGGQGTTRNSTTTGPFFREMHRLAHASAVSTSVERAIHFNRLESGRNECVESGHLFGLAAEGFES